MTPLHLFLQAYALANRFWVTFTIHNNLIATITIHNNLLQSKHERKYDTMVQKGKNREMSSCGIVFFQILMALLHSFKRKSLQCKQTGVEGNKVKVV